MVKSGKYINRGENNMNYKIGNKVIIRTWEDMEKKNFLDEEGDIHISQDYFTREMEEFVKNQPMRIVEIETVHGEGGYEINKLEYSIHNEMIKGLAK